MNTNKTFKSQEHRKSTSVYRNTNLNNIKIIFLDKIANDKTRQEGRLV